MSTLFSGHYLRNRSTLDIGIVYHKGHSPEVFHIPPGTPCILTLVCHFNCLEYEMQVTLPP